MKKIISLVLTISIIFSASCLSAYATNTSEAGSSPVWTIESFPSGEEYLYNEISGEIIAKAFCFDETGNLIELDLQEYLLTKNSPSYTSGSSNLSGPPLFSTAAVGPNPDDFLRRDTWAYEYRETRTYVTSGDPIKVSADLKGPGTISHLTSIQIGHTFGGDVSFTATIKNAVQLGASFVWNVSAATEESNTYAVDVPAGRTGYVQFTPRFDVTVGDLYYVYTAPFVSEETYLGEVWGSSPRMLDNGFADGTYELVYI